jgi:hypothetical protein
MEVQMDKKIVDYCIIAGTPNEYLEFVEGVNKAIKAGWQPYGPPFSDPKRMTIQAIVKYEENPKRKDEA